MRSRGCFRGRRLRRLCQNQDFQDWRDLQDFAFARISLFAIAGDFCKTNGDERLPVENARQGNPENPIIP